MDAPPDDSAARVVAGNDRFAFDLYGKLAKEPGNLFFSPYSISTALAMTHAGARGETAPQMAKTLSLELPETVLTEGFRSLRTTLVANPADAGYRLAIANRLWGQEGFKVSSAFQTLNRETFGSDLALVDFVRQTDQARLTINGWVERETQDRIKDLIKPSDIDGTTRLVLTNAIYFKADWASPFEKSATRDLPFLVSESDKPPVPMMQRTATLPYWAGEGLKVVGIPYVRNELSMFVLLPDRPDGLPALEAKLSAGNVTKWLGGVGKARVHLFLPKFTGTSETRLADVLKAMGMTRVFSPGAADLSGICDDEPLYLSQVIHKAFVKVDEEGSEASAATAAVAIRAMAVMRPTPPVEFRADHPFVYLIRDNRTGSILFLGRMTQPQK